MTSLPRVTVITPSYNQAAYLEQTICSVLDQNYPNLEYFVIDGASTDSSVDIIRKYEKRLAWWVSEQDCGQAEAINKGFARATGEYIAWINSDDLHMPGIICTMVDAFSHTPDVGLIYGDVVSIDQDGKPFNIMRYDNWTLDDLMAFSIIGQAGTFFRHSVLQKTGYLDTRFHCLLDHHLWLRMAQVAPIRHLPGVVAAARFHPEAKNVARAAEFAHEAYELMDWMRTQPELAQRINRHVWAGAHRFHARYLLDGDQPFASLKAYMRSLWMHPPTALTEWHRIIYAVLALLGLTRLKPLFYRLRRAFQSQRDPSIYKYQ